MVSTTSWGRSPRTSASRPGTRHVLSFQRSGRGCHKVPRLWVSRSYLRGICQGGAVTRSISSGNQVRVGQYGATSKTCSSSSLILHSVCARMLTGGERILAGAPRPAECQCIPCRVFPRSGSKQLAMRSLSISWAVWGWSLHSPGSAARDSSSVARLSKPGMWMARSDLRCFWLHRRRWRASCDMRRKPRPPYRLMYATVTVCPYGPVRACPVSASWDGSGPGVLQQL